MTNAVVPHIAARIDRLPAHRHLWWLVALISFGGFFEIYDLALSAPLALGLQASHIFNAGAKGLSGLNDQATFLALTFAGLYLGTLLFSFVADRLGRRPVFTAALLWYSLATIAMGLQTTAIGVDAWRFVSGIGVGLELVAIDCYLAELMPKALRGRGFAYSTSIQFLSAPLAAILAWRFIPGHVLGIEGWRVLTFVPAVGAALVWWVRRGLPESPRWLEAHGRMVDAESTMTDLEARCGATAAPRPAAPSRLVEPVKVVSLFAPAYRKRTIALVLFHLFQTLGYYGFNNWLPTLLVAHGVTVSRSLGYTAVLAVVPAVGPLLFSTFADVFERKWMVVAGALLAAACGLLLARTTANSSAAFYILAGTGVALGASLMSFAYHTYQGELFPTAIRARGVGFVYSFSRLSAIFSGYLIAYTLAKSGSGGVFILISGAMGVVALVIGALGPRTRGLALEQI